MNYVIKAILAISLLSGCNVAPHNAYEQDKSPENRQFYTGSTGFKQYLKDETYLAKKVQNLECQKYLLSFLDKHRQGSKLACTDKQLATAEELERLQQ